jgi:hypothetical protein
MAGLGKQAKALEQGLVKQGYAQGGNSATQTIEQKLQLQVQGVLVGGKGVEGATSQGFSVSLSPSSNRGSTVGPGPLGLASVAAVMAPQGHAMIHSMAEGGRSQGVRGPQLQLGVGTGHSNMMHHHHQQHPLMQLQHSQLQHAQSNLQHQAVSLRISCIFWFYVFWVWGYGGFFLVYFERVSCGMESYEFLFLGLESLS